MKVLQIIELGLLIELRGQTINIVGKETKELNFIDESFAELWFDTAINLIESLEDFTL